MRELPRVIASSLRLSARRASLRTALGLAPILILSRHGFVATFFVIAGQIGEAWQLSPAQMRELIAAGKRTYPQDLPDRLSRYVS